MVVLAVIISLTFTFFIIYSDKTTEYFDKKRDESSKGLLILVEERFRYKRLSEKYKKTLKLINDRFYNIGGSLNDNVLKFNNKQMSYIYDIKELIVETIEGK